MKIDTDLRLAIKAAERAQPTPTWQEQEKRRKQAIADLIALPKHSVYVRRALQRIKLLREKLAEHMKVIDDLGINVELDRIRDDVKFEKAGGKEPVSPNRWKADAVMAELVKAAPADARKILKRLGINWES